MSMDGTRTKDRRLRATRYSQIWRRRRFSSQARSVARSAAGFLLATGAKFPSPSSESSIIFPYYHHVLDDECRSFDRQLKYMRRFGDFISLDDALAAMRDPSGIDGRYFCVSFDDGFRSCVTNALPVLVDNGCPAAFYVPTDYIGLDLDEDWEVIKNFYDGAKGYSLPMEFLSWDECRELDAAGMTIGSHTCSHARLTSLSTSKLLDELERSRARIEYELGKPCLHFACPWGRPGRDFNPVTHVSSVRDAGYCSLVTTQRGTNHAGTDPFAILRQEFEANESPSMLRYMFARAA